MRSFLVSIQILCLAGSFTTVYAQRASPLSTRVEQSSSYYSRQTARVASATPYTVRPDFAFTSVSLKINHPATFEGAYVVHRQDTFYLRADEHGTDDISDRRSALVVFDEPVDELLFYPATMRGPVSFSFFNAQGEKKSRSHSLRSRAPQRSTADCQEPSFVPAAAWQTGLPPPSYSRRITSVAHVIVHHSATFNTLENYENVVRNIYLFHTQDRGWSDIGYNYLIAQDGTIFEGRSAESADQENDNVQGAHFCGKNSSTMGVCLLGNYNTAEPTDTAVASLAKLTAWKLTKEGLDPQGERSHPANAMLPTVAGHRNGCATECPGENLYDRLEEIRSTVAELVVDGCADTPPVLSVYPVPAASALTVALPDSLRLDALTVYDLRGRQWSISMSESQRTLTLDTRSLATGAYVLHLRGPGWEEHRKFLVE